MPTRDQVRRVLGDGCDYEAAARKLGIPPGQVYMIATGVPADGSDTITEAEARRPGFLLSSQHLSNPPHENPTTEDAVRAWLAARVGADTQMRAALRERTPEPPEIDPETEKQSHDAVTVLGRQHSQVRYLLKQLQALPSHTTGGSPEQMSARKSIVDMITVRLSEHEAIEEKHFWHAVRKALADGDQYADQALEQEKEGTDTLTELGRMDPDSREFDAHVERLVKQLRKHVAFEEQVFLKVREAIPKDRLDRLGEKLLAAPKTASARPQRRAPQRRGAAMDKARDGAGDRPAERKGQPRQRNENEQATNEEGRDA